MDSKILTPLAYTKLVVRDLQRQCDFYQSVLGYERGQFVTGKIGGRALEEFMLIGADGKIELMILAYVDGGAAPSPSGVITLFFTRDLDAFQARVLAAGGAVHQPIGPLPMGEKTRRLAFFSDPEGYLLEVIEN